MPPQAECTLERAALDARTSCHVRLNLSLLVRCQCVHSRGQNVLQLSGHPSLLRHRTQSMSGAKRQSLLLDARAGLSAAEGGAAAG